MHPQERKLYAVIVHYGDTDLIDRAVTSLLNGTKQPDEIVVVDHNPTATVLDTGDERVRLVRPSTNDGYGAGLNFGLGTLFRDKPGPADIVVGMNNDVEVLPSTTANLLQWWKDNPEPALVGVISKEGDRVVAGGGRVNPLTGRANLSPKPFVDTALAYVHGAFFSAPWDVLMQVRGLPEHYFMYWEDISLSMRARQVGVPLKVAGSVQVQHSEESPSQLPDHKLYYLVRNGALCLSAESPWPYRHWWKLMNRLRLKYHRARGAQPIVVEALQDALAGRSGKRSSASL